jgi:hypothetical protein
MTTIYESEIEQVTLELLRDEGGGRGVSQYAPTHPCISWYL